MSAALQLDSRAGTTLKQAAPVFLAFAFAYFLSALLRAVTATLAPVFSVELGLRAADLGLLAGAYFFGFAAMQLPLGRALDRFGPRRVLLAMLSLAVLGCLGFAAARDIGSLIAARVLIGMGVAACLMAPLTCFRSLLDANAQLRANSWMLMTGSLGMLASTVPTQMLLPHWGWRGLFVALAALLAVAIVLIAMQAPRGAAPASLAGPAGSYRTIMRHPAFVALAPLGFFSYGGLIAIQSLWAGPWLTEVTGWSAVESAQGLFAINLCMLFAFAGWGALMPRLARKGIGARQLITWGLPVSMAWLVVIAILGPAAGAAAWACWCVLSTFVSPSQPALGQAFPAALAGRALSAFNLVIFAGVFCLQWGIGLAIDGLIAAGWSRVAAFQGAMVAFAACCIASQVWFFRATGTNADNGL